MLTRPVDYGGLSRLVTSFKPKVIVSPSSLDFITVLDYPSLRAITENVDAHLIVDMYSDAGLICAAMAPNPFPHADIVITATQSSLRGPLGALIFYRRDVDVPFLNARDGSTTSWNLGRAVNMSVFPSHQGEPHCHAIVGIAVALRQARTAAFAKYQEIGAANAQKLGNASRA